MDELVLDHDNLMLCRCIPRVLLLQYVEATRLIREQALAKPPIFKKDSRLGVQAWHILVTILLWSSISETYTGNAIRNVVTEIFTFN